MKYTLEYINTILIVLCILHLNLFLVCSGANNQDYDDYKARTPAFSLIEVFNPKWVGNAGFACFADSSTIPFAKIINPDITNVSDLTEACAIEFYIEPRRTSVVNIDDIIIEVYSFNPMPPNMSLESTLASTPANVFYAEIDNPILSQKNCFEANPIIDGKVINNGFILNNIYLKEDNPEPFIIRVNARTPGIYTFSCIILARYEDDKERIMINNRENPFRFLFIN